MVSTPANSVTSPLFSSSVAETTVQVESSSLSSDYRQTVVSPKTYLSFRRKSGDTDTFALDVNDRLSRLRVADNTTETIVKMAPGVFVAVIVSAIIAAVFLAAILAYGVYAYAPLRRVLMAWMRRKLRMRESPPPSYDVSLA